MGGDSVGEGVHGGDVGVGEVSREDAEGAEGAGESVLGTRRKLMVVVLLGVLVLSIVTVVLFLALRR